MIRSDQIFVGVQQRIDGLGRWAWPEAYVRVVLPADSVDTSNLTPATARDLAKALKLYANLIDPPKPRRPRA